MTVTFGLSEWYSTISLHGLMPKIWTFCLFTSQPTKNKVWSLNTIHFRKLYCSILADISIRSSVCRKCIQQLPEYESCVADPVSQKDCDSTVHICKEDSYNCKIRNLKHRQQAYNEQIEGGCKITPPWCKPVQEGIKSIRVTMKNGHEETTRCIHLSFLSFLILVPISKLVANYDESTSRSPQDDWVRCKNPHF